MITASKTPPITQYHFGCFSECSYSGASQAKEEFSKTAASPAFCLAICFENLFPGIFFGYFSEARGFEPLEPLRVLQFSRLVQSSTLPRLHIWCGTSCRFRPLSHPTIIFGEGGIRTSLRALKPCGFNTSAAGKLTFSR